MDFSDIALAKLLQTVPELGNYIITFKDVSEELQDDTGIQVGVFVLRVGAEIFYVPVVAKNDNVYPIDSIFFDTEKKFFPLTRKTVTVIINSSQLDQGRPTDIPKTVVGNPNVADMINPPRTGKHVYASTSRLTDFLAAMPGYLKQVTMEKIAAEKSVYDALDEMYGLKAIFDVLAARPQGMAVKTNEVPISVVTDANPNMSQEQISSILTDGYHLFGEQPTSRVAVSIHDFNTSGTFRNITNLDGDRDYEVMLSNGTSRDAYIPKMYTLGSNPRGVSGLRDEPTPKTSLAIFSSGDYAISDSFIAVGETLDRKQVLSTLFNFTPPVLLKDVESGDRIVIVLNSGEFLGPIYVNRVALTSFGVELKGSSSQAGFGGVSIFGYRNVPDIKVCGAGYSKDIFVPHNSVVIRLGDDLTGSLEVNVNSATHKRLLTETQLLGEELNLGYDGIEFAINGKTAGAEPDVMKRLVVQECLDPEDAMKFVKQAKEVKFVKIYMTKAAGFTNAGVGDGNIPNYGEEDLTGIDPSEVTMNGAYQPNGNFINNVQDSLDTGDAQITEATIISELLQAPDMFELIEEYLPDIEEAIDKLGRVLFMARVHVSRLAEANDADQVYAFLASLKTVYRLLGDNFLKLKEMAAVADTTDTEAPGKQMAVKE